MVDFVNKVITIILIFVMLVVAPLTISYMTNDMMMKRSILNEVTQFIDIVTDKGSVVDSDLDRLYLNVNSYGSTFDVDVRRMIRVASEHTDAVSGLPVIETKYFSDDNLEVFNVGDVVKVSVSEVGISASTRFLWNILRLDVGTFEFSLAGSVR